MTEQFNDDVSKDDDKKKETNPKRALGINKVSIHVLSMQVMGELALAFTEGGCKYGSHNYREMGVRASTYIDAVWRHLFLQWWEGEDIDADSGLSHVTKAIASLVVLRDSMIMGNWVDDRPIRSKQMTKLFNELTTEVLKKYPECHEPYLHVGTEIHEQIEKSITDAPFDIPEHDYSELCYCQNCQARRHAG